MSRDGGRSLRQRDQAVVAVVGSLVLAAIVALALSYSSLPFVDNQTGYTAQFGYAGGLRSGDDVRVGGVSVGSVDSVDLAGNRVDVHFSVGPDLELGDESSASVEVATVLGNVYLAIESAGRGRLRPDTPIPVSRTTTPYTVLDALGGVAKISGDTDLGSLRSSLQVVAGTLNDISKGDVQATLNGLTKVSTALAGRQTEIRRLLAGTQQIVSVLQSRSSSLIALLGNTDIFLKMLNQRHAVVQDLFRNASALGAEVATLVERNNAPLTAALRSVNTITGLLQKDDAALRRSITLLGQFSTNFANATGNGPFLDILLPSGLIPDNVIAACGTHPKPGCGNR